MSKIFRIDTIESELVLNEARIQQQFVDDVIGESIAATFKYNDYNYITDTVVSHFSDITLLLRKIITEITYKNN